MRPLQRGRAPREGQQGRKGRHGFAAGRAANVPGILDVAAEGL
tara:strand:+ start:5625 stop:5753 length:129 start_codon:yes stop_codon:yes gene_type:complete